MISFEDARALAESAYKKRFPKLSDLTVLADREGLDAGDCWIVGMYSQEGLVDVGKALVGGPSVFVNKETGEVRFGVVPPSYSVFDPSVVHVSVDAPST